jgi:uncharacterized tellurite resistance protein B-like protein
MEDRIEAVCDLLMGAAYADKELHDKEKQVVTDYLGSLLPDGELTEEIEERIANFSPEGFKLGDVLSQFSDDSEEDRKKLLEVVAAVHSADEEYDLDEDDFITMVAAGLLLSDEDAKKHLLDYEVESLKEYMAKLRPSPPPVPGAAAASEDSEDSEDIDVSDGSEDSEDSDPKE